MSTANLPAIGNNYSPPMIPGDIVRNLDDLWQLAELLVHSGMLPSTIKTPQAAAAIILKGRELGIPAMESFSGITVIQGKPTVSPQLMLSLINRSGLLEDLAIDDESDTAVVWMKRKGRSKEHTERFSMADAKAMQLTGKDNWIKQPRTMRKWRAVAACARVVFPDVISGMYTHEEMGADVDERGDIVHVPEVHEGEYIPPRPQQSEKPNNNTGHGKGQYASPQQRAEFEKRFKDFLEGYKQRWLDQWMDPHTGEVINTEELTNEFQVVNHLIKWCREGNRLEIAEGRISLDQGFKYLAILFHRSEPEKKSLLKELKGYLEKLMSERSHAFYLKNPEHATREWLVENRPDLLTDLDPADAPGDASEPIEAEVEESIPY